jgi:Protein of unknown function (DUF1553)
MIMLSATYQQQSSESDAAAAAVARERDPENRLLWKMTRRRLDWESLRDALLAVSGRLDTEMGGPAVDLFKAPFSTRRSVYGYIDRQSLASALRTFDFASPDSSTAQRHETTVPQQALYLWNNEFLKQCTQWVSARPEIAKADSSDDRIDTLYRLLFGRPATQDERKLIGNYVATNTPSGDTPPAEGQFLSRWEEVIHALLLSNEFVFVD